MKPTDGDRPPLSRRDFIKNLAVSGALLQNERRTKTAATRSRAKTTSGLIDRRELAGRHSPMIKKLDPVSPLSVGNGEFAFTADVTGLQSFPEEYDRAMPLCAMSVGLAHRATSEELRARSCG
jgi:hypothetical protein